MGVREMEEYISKTEKELFNLKLDLYQMRHRAEAADKQLTRMSEVEAENERLRKWNEILQKDIRDHDAALTIAVELINMLDEEAKSDRLAAQSRASSATTPTQTSRALSATGHLVVPAFIYDATNSPATTPLRRKLSFLPRVNGKQEHTPEPMRQGRDP